MLKILKKDDTTTTPYVATKNWNLSNVDNEDLVLAENGNEVAVESLIYTYTSIETASLCSVAKEEQENDLASYREGLKLSGLFYPDLDPQNLDGTYKRILYNQIKTMFYNDYRDPTKMWGLEKIDFDTSEVKKFLSDYIKIFYVPTDIMGQSIVKNSIVLTDNSIDNVYTITDDGNCNLFAGTNLFSKVQIIGDFNNFFVTGSDGNCNQYFILPGTVLPPIGTIVLTVTGSTTASADIDWVTDISGEDYWDLYRSIDGINFSSYVTTSAGITSYLDTGVTSSVEGSTYWYKVIAINSAGSSSFSNTASVTFTSSVPTVPIVLTVTSGSSILNWNSASNNDTSYIMEKSINGIDFSYLDTVNIVYSSLITNGGFETGDFTGWTQSNATFTSIKTTANRVHSGTYGLEKGDYPTEGFISQIITTGNGFSYNVSFWMYGDTDTTVTVYWEGVAIDTIIDPVASWTKYSYDVIATGPTSEIKLGVVENNTYIGIDDIYIPSSDGTLATTLTDTDVTSSFAGATYWYRVAATGDYGTSSYSNTASITFITPAPVVPECMVTTGIVQI